MAIDKNITDKTVDAGSKGNTLYDEQIPTGCKENFKGIMEILLFAIAAVLRTSPLLLILLAITTIFSGLMPFLTVYTGKLVLNAIVSILQTNATEAEISELAVAMLLQLMVFVSSGLFDQAGTYLNFLIGKRLSLNMTAGVIKKAIGLDYAFFENPRFYDMMSRAQRESNGKPLIIVFEITSIIRSSITFASMGGLIASVSPALFAAMVLVCLPLLFIKLRYGRENHSLQYSRTEDIRLAGYTSSLMMARQYVAEILSFGLYQYLFKKWLGASENFLKQDIRLNRKRSVAETLAGFLMTCSTAAATGYIIYLGVTKSPAMAIGEIVMYSGAFSGGLASIKTALGDISDIYQNSLFLHDLIEFHKVQPSIEVKCKGKAIPAAVESIELQNVSFRYPDSMQYALKNINAVFNRSKSTLIVGDNGAGKTTLIKLLIRLYDPTEGRILINGIDIRDFEIESLRKSIGVIFQEFVRYAFSAKENIGFGDIHQIEDTGKIIAAARRAKADSFIERFPQQYDIILSRLFKNGQELSLGQWQRICLSRLFMKNPPVLVLDEPTASLDIETEAHLLQEIAGLSRDKICILVSHRMFREDIADQIVVLGKGQIVENGTYRELIHGNGEFARLWKIYHKRIEEKVDSMAAF